MSDRGLTEVGQRLERSRRGGMKYEVRQREGLNAIDELNTWKD